MHRIPIEYQIDRMWVNLYDDILYLKQSKKLKRAAEKCKVTLKVLFLMLTACSPEETIKNKTEKTDILEVQTKKKK